MAADQVLAGIRNGFVYAAIILLLVVTLPHETGSNCCLLSEKSRRLLFRSIDLLQTSCFQSWVEELKITGLIRKSQLFHCTVKARQEQQNSTGARNV